MQALTSDIVRNSYGDGLFATMFATLTSVWRLSPNSPG